MFELPHLTFPLFRVMDRVIVTPPGGELPELGQELKEDEQQRKDRRAGRGEAMSFKQGYTYSFSFHSMYTDFSRWAICNFPGYKAIDIRGFFGQQHINVVCYEISEKDLVSENVGGMCVCVLQIAYDVVLYDADGNWQGATLQCIQALFANTGIEARVVHEC